MKVWKKILTLMAVLLMTAAYACAQTKISGTVRDETGEPLFGATVILEEGGKTVYAVVDKDGIFSLSVRNPKTATLKVSLLSMEDQVVKLEGRTKVDIVMKEAMNRLDDVVVTGYQTMSKREMASAVSVVKANDIMLAGAVSIDQMLQGQVAGMVVTQSSGSPSSVAKIRIRGTSSIIGNKSPLWVLDGVVLTEDVNVDHSDLTGEDSEYLVGNAIAGINPADIESITVLKDASATAIYGVQAANGVIVVTTKKGRTGAPKVSYQGSVSFAQRESYDRLNLMDAEERVNLSKEIRESGLLYPRTNYTIGYEYLYSMYSKKLMTKDQFTERVQAMIDGNTDWFDILYRNSVSHSHAVNVSGGTDRTTYYASLGIDNSQGTAREELTRRYTATAKIGSWIRPKFYAGFQINASYTENSGYNTSVASPRSWAYNTARTIPCYNEDGSLFYYQPYYDSSAYLDVLTRNYLNEIEQSGSESNTANLTAKLNLSWNILKWLKYELQGSFIYNGRNTESYAGQESYYIATIRKWSSSYQGYLIEGKENEWENSPLPQGGILDTSNNKTLTYNVRNQLTFNKEIDGHTVSVVGISEINSSDSKVFSGTYYGYYPDRGYVISPFLTDKYISTLSSLNPVMSVNTRNTASFRFIGTYSYLDRYTLNGNVSMDGSNQFGSNPEYRFLPIWSVSGKWTISREKWVNKRIFPYLAARVSYGIQGNVDPSTSPDLVLKIGKVNSYTKMPESSIQYYPNADLRWEKTTSYNLGLDFSLFGDYVSGTVDYYDKVGTDMIMTKTISGISGLSSFKINAGSMRNTGVEVSVKLQPINTHNWTVYVTGIYGYNKNVLLTANDDYELTTSELLSGSALIVGQALGTFYSYDFAGLDHDSGLPVFRDINGSTTFTKNGVEYPYTTIKKTDVNLVASGVIDPPHNGSINFGIRYRNWRLNGSFTYTLGGVNRLPKIYGSSANTFDPEMNVSKDIIDRWKQPGDEEYTDIPALYDENTYNKIVASGAAPDYTGSSLLYGYSMYDYSTARICRTDNFRFRSISLTYRFPSELMQKLKIDDLSIRGQVSNIFLLADKRWHGSDPLLGSSATSSIPMTASVTLSMTF